jgi:hypothetical protein
MVDHRKPRLRQGPSPMVEFQPPHRRVRHRRVPSPKPKTGGSPERSQCRRRAAFFTSLRVGQGWRLMIRIKAATIAATVERPIPTVRGLSFTNAILVAGKVIEKMNTPITPRIIPCLSSYTPGRLTVCEPGNGLIINRCVYNCRGQGEGYPCPPNRHV